MLSIWEHSTISNVCANLKSLSIKILFKNNYLRAPNILQADNRMWKLLSCWGEYIFPFSCGLEGSWQIAPPEGGAKSQENNGKKSYFRETNLEPNQGVFPTSSLGTCQYLPRTTSELLQILPLLQWDGYFCYPASVLLEYVEWGEGSYSANTHFYPPFLIYVKSFLPSH